MKNSQRLLEETQLEEEIQMSSKHMNGDQLHSTKKNAQYKYNKVFGFLYCQKF